LKYFKSKTKKIKIKIINQSSGWNENFLDEKLRMSKKITSTKKQQQQIIHSISSKKYFILSLFIKLVETRSPHSELCYITMSTNFFSVLHYLNSGCSKEAKMWGGGRRFFSENFYSLSEEGIKQKNIKFSKIGGGGRRGELPLETPLLQINQKVGQFL
jgi:hypothetical protein